MLAGLAATAFFALRLNRSAGFPLAPLGAGFAGDTTRLYDFLGAAAGYRRLAADIAWVEVLEYYGTPEPGATELDDENAAGHYPRLLSYCERVARLDPSFTFVYYYGGGSLGWNLNRWAEAEDLLRQGIRANPKEYRLQQYLAAIAYGESRDRSKLIAFLETFVGDPDCPNLLRSLLANAYKKEKRYKKAMQIWFLVLDSADPGYIDRAKEQIQELSVLSHMGPGAS